MPDAPPNLDNISEDSKDRDTRIAPEPEADEFYFEGPFLVFTEAYHLRRGWCCQSGCRHCPYGFQKTPAGDEANPPA
ncbi:DUF5522 domain-containing protein [Acidicapsa ligni]|uniref:DUF5522 domain-containing protein n=1 Tax=Acidicapsa ligni TaxID=542300 RepID=UPI0021E0AC4F|nr:DUF5522 domain-containing protein [Acidicapsa ligni]